MMDKMQRFFVERTRKHIGRVQDFCEKAAEFFPEIADEIIQRGVDHDKSKFMIPERKWYVILTWQYKMKNEGKEFKISQREQEHINEMTFHHVKNNAHHPESWDKGLKDNPVNKDDRSKRDVMPDASGMDKLSMIEMVSDWAAMSLEYDELDGPKKWADESFKRRWKFTKQQQDFVYEVIDLIWR